MHNSLKLAMIAGVVSLIGSTAQAALPLYSATFEAAPYVTNETISGKDGWIVTGAEARVVTGAGAQNSARFVELSPGAQIDRSFGDVAALNAIPGPPIVWVEGYFRGDGADSTLAQALTNYPATDASAIVHFSTANGIEFLDGNGSGGAASIQNAGVALTPNNWFKITIRLNFADKKWDVWVNNDLKHLALGFRSNSTNKLSGFKNLAQNTAYFDSFRVVLPVAGDVNGDSKKDAADVSALVIASTVLPSDPAYDVITRYNAQLANPPAISPADYTTLARNIAGQ